MRLIHGRIFVWVVVILVVSAVPARPDMAAAKRALEKQDYTTALKELTPLADKGDAEAQDLLGLMHATGRGVPLSPARALPLYKASAAQGNAGGEFHLGSLYLMGAGTARNIPEGLRLLTLSAEQGRHDAQVMLGMAYSNLQGIPRDFVQADKWLLVAETPGDTFVSAKRIDLEGRMTPAQVAQALALAKAFRPRASAGVRTTIQPVPVSKH